jgi:hypothetical protein
LLQSVLGLLIRARIGDRRDVRAAHRIVYIARNGDP